MADRVAAAAAERTAQREGRGGAVLSASHAPPAAAALLPEPMFCNAKPAGAGQRTGDSSRGWAQRVRDSDGLYTRSRSRTGTKLHHSTAITRRTQYGWTVVSKYVAVAISESEAIRTSRFLYSCKCQTIYRLQLRVPCSVRRLRPPPAPWLSRVAFLLSFLI